MESIIRRMLILIAKGCIKDIEKTVEIKNETAEERKERLISEEMKKIEQEDNYSIFEIIGAIIGWGFIILMISFFINVIKGGM